MLEEDVRKLFQINEHCDERGFSLFFGNFPVEKFHMASIEPGAVRGDHVHAYDEILCVIGGEEVAEISLKNLEVSSRVIVQDEYHVIRIPAGVRHKIKNVGNRCFYLVGFSIKNKAEDHGRKPVGI